MRKSTLIVTFCLVLGVGLAPAQNTEVVTGGHVLSAMMTPNLTSCTDSITGSLDPVFKGADTQIDLVCQSATCPTCGNAQVVATTRRCIVDVCTSTVDQCTGKYSMTIQGDASSGSCVLQAPAGSVCYFVAHVSSTNRQQCNGATSDSGPDPSGTAPCSGGYCPP